MTRSAQQFVGWMTFQALSGMPVCTDLFEKGDEASFQHIDWAAEADLVVVAPATANIIGKMANGIADDALSTFMTVVRSPVIVCPSMNANMFQHPAVQRNIKTLIDDGAVIVAPDAGDLACGTVGPGRLPEPAAILDRIVAGLTPKDLLDKRVLVTAGPTREPIDPVRFISNPSTGKMGYAVARAAEHRGASVTLIAGPCDLAPPANVSVIQVNTAEEMARAVFDNADTSEIVIKTAAVSDYRPTGTADHKLKKGEALTSLPLEKTEDILEQLGRNKRGRVLVGFAAETEDLDQNAQQKLTEKNLDIIAGNLIGNPASGFASDTNRVTLYFRDGSQEVVPEMEKDAVAHILLNRIVERLLPAEGQLSGQ
jgi:phosphopantothenoylcysteine decarboxylase/phosphopantothenate--cysteine ligase